MAKRKRGADDKSADTKAFHEIDRDGWTRLEAVLTATEATDVSNRCARFLATVNDDYRTGDKPHAGTERLVNLADRLPDVVALFQRAELSDIVNAALGPDAICTEVTFRNPQPGFGQQQLHADDVPLVDCSQTLGLTGILPLVDFTPINGSTRIVPGSHRRPDLQRLSGNLPHHRDERRLIGRAGDLFIFSRHLLHSGTRNESSETRPALQISWARQPT